MIKYFAVENFRSIKSEVVLDFDINAKNNIHIHPVIGIAGANASGKTTILQALTFTLWFMQDSFLNIGENESIPFEQFCTSMQDPTKFHLIFATKTKVNDITKYVDYEYQLQLIPEKVLQEKLYYYPHKRRRLVYQRNENKLKFGNLTPMPAVGLGMFQRDLRPNCSIVSYASQYQSQKIAATCKEYFSMSNVSSEGLNEFKFTVEDVTQLIENDPKHNKIKQFLSIADVGIADITLEEVSEEALSKAIEVYKSLNTEQRNKLPKALIESLNTLTNNPEVSVHEIAFRHQIGNKLINFQPTQESSGTRKFLAILARVIIALEEGRLLILDEIELKLHQNLVAYLIGLFQNPHENSHGGQLIFSFHNTSLMTILEPEQLWFTEKNDFGETELFSAIDFEDIRNIHKKDLEKLYRIGRFGAVPKGL